MRTRRVRADQYPTSPDDPCPLCGDELDLTWTCSGCDAHYKRPGEFDRDEEDYDIKYLTVEVWGD